MSEEKKATNTIKSAMKHRRDSTSKKTTASLPIRTGTSEHKVVFRKKHNTKELAGEGARGLESSAVPFTH